MKRSSMPVLNLAAFSRPALADRPPNATARHLPRRNHNGRLQARHLSLAAFIHDRFSAGGGPASSQDHRNEVMAHLIDPLFPRRIRNEGLDEMLGGADEALDLAQILQASAVENVVSAVTPFPVGQDAVARETFCAVFLMQRLCGMAQGRQR